METHPASLFARIAGADPERLAIDSPAGRLTYRQLLHRAEWLAGRLPSGDATILVYGHKEPALVVAFLAALRCGRAYVPVDTAVPPARFLRILDLARPGLVVAAQAMPEQVAAALARRDLPSIALGPLAAALETAASPPLLPPPARRPDDAAYIMFTSGTTGDPKGVPIPVRGLEHFTSWFLQLEPFRRGAEVFLNQAPFNFDLSVMDLYGALLSGGMLFAIDRAAIADPRLLFARLAGAPITTWVSTPSFARFCLTEPRFNQALLPALRRFVFCGETLPPTVVRELWQRFPGAAVWNTYGPTEATVAVTAVRLTEAMAMAGGPLPVGRAAPGMDVWVADPADAQRRLPDGTTGEIIIAGPQVALGYRTVGTPEAAPADPFITLPGGTRAYRTGDLGYRNTTDGYLYCAGRLDRQVKLHGYRLELEEIEATLRRLPGVAEAAVLAVERGGHPDALVAFVVPAQEPDAPALPDGPLALTHYVRDGLAEHLPAYALPRRVRLLAQPPLTANGKLDRQALEALAR